MPFFCFLNVPTLRHGSVLHSTPWPSWCLQWRCPTPIISWQYGGGFLLCLFHSCQFWDSTFIQQILKESRLLVIIALVHIGHVLQNIQPIQHLFRQVCLTGGKITQFYEKNRHLLRQNFIVLVLQKNSVEKRWKISWLRYWGTQGFLLKYFSMDLRIFMIRDRS